MEKEVRTGPHSLYKGKYQIVFYDRYDEEYLYSFDNVRDILKFMNKQVTRKNVLLISKYIYRALRGTGKVRFLKNEVMTLHIVDVDD